jgi:class 3 adenylate cyclase/tetratricopeptide (TPR) repeat protein
VTVCQSCGHENPDGARFCNGCGAQLEPTAAAAREERKVVTVVFADLVGSTAAAERSDPEDVRAMLAAHHARVRTELERFGGTVEKFIGDAVVAVFGAPVVHEDDPERAVRAALAIRDAAGEAGVELRVAVNTGEALVSIDARPADGEGMVAGDVVNTAARIQSAAPVNGVVVGESTFRATEQLIEYRTREPVAAKGKAEPVRVWEAVAPRARFGSDMELAPLVALVGRDEEVDALRDALSRARRRHEPQLVTVVGVPGIGKSRLVSEAFRIVDEDEEIITWRQGRCLPYGEGISYWALGEMAKAQAGVLETDSAAETEAKLIAAITALLPDADDSVWVAGHLRPLLGLATDAMAGGDDRGEAFAAWRRFCESLAEQRPTVLVFEDLHWADDGLLDFVDGLVDRATGVPLLVLCSARPELLTRRPGWGGGKANAITLSLAPLSDKDTALLVAEHLAQAVLPASLQQTLLRRAEGNPLFAGEYIRMLRDRGLLRFDGETWRLDESDVEVPETVQGIIAARLDALEPEEKELLQAAAVVGKVFWLGSVAAVAGVEPWEAEERLHVLERKELVRRDRRGSVAGEMEYSVRHVLVRDVAYGQIPRVRRADLHVRAAEWIESLGADRAEDRSEMLVHHYVAALDLTRAAGGDTVSLETPARIALREAGDRAHALSALEVAVRHYRHALALWPDEDPAYAILLAECGKALAWLRAEGEEELLLASERFVAAGDLEAAADAEAALADIYRAKGRQAECRRRCERATGLLVGLPETRTTVRVRATVWRFAVLGGDDVPLDEGRRIVDLSEALGSSQEHLSAWITLGLAQSASGDPEAGIRETERALEQALAVKSHYAVRATANLASLLGVFGDLARCAQVHRDGVELARRLGSRLEHWLVAECAIDEYLAGDWDAAIARATEYLEHRGSARFMDSGAFHVLAAVADARGDRAVADGHAAIMVDCAREGREPQVLLGGLGAGALLALEARDEEKANELFRELLTSSSALRRVEMTPDLIHGCLAASSLGRGGELAEQLAKAAYDSPWVDAGRLICAGQLDEAGDVLEAAGASSYAAHARLHAAERTGRETPGLRAAVAFYERVGATAYLARAEQLMQATA